MSVASLVVAHLARFRLYLAQFARSGAALTFALGGQTALRISRRMSLEEIIEVALRTASSGGPRVASAARRTEG